MAFLRACLEKPRRWSVERGSVRRERVGASSSLHALTLHARHLLRRALCAIVVCCLSLAGLSARGQVAKEYDLKAVFLCKFALFVEWPTNAFPEAKTPITIGVLGSDPFGKSLTEAVRNEIVQERKLVVEFYSSVESIINLADETNKICHILFVSQSESG